MSELIKEELEEIKKQIGTITVDIPSDVDPSTLNTIQKEKIAILTNTSFSKENNQFIFMGFPDDLNDARTVITSCFIDAKLRKQIKTVKKKEGEVSYFEY